MHKTTLLASAALVGLAATAQASVIDFETIQIGGVTTDLEAGNIIGDVSTGGVGELVINGVTIGISASGGANVAMIFDTDNPSGGDDDLEATFFSDFTGTAPRNGTPAAGAEESNPGNVLIISEDGDQDDPDDNGRGGEITFTFDEAVTFLGFDVFDDVTNFIVFGNGDDFETDPINLAYDNQFTSVKGLNWEGITSLTFDFGGASGAIDNIAFLTADENEPEPVPIPASLPLLLAGLGGLGIMRRRRKAS